MPSRPVRFLNEILHDAFAFGTGLENDDLRLVSRSWSNVVSKGESSLPLRSLYKVSIQSRWELDEDRVDSPTFYSAEIETDYNEAFVPPTETVNAYAASPEQLCDKIIPLLRNSFVSTLEIDLDHMTAPICQRLQEVLPSISVQWLDLMMSKIAAPAAVFHAFIGSFRQASDISLASARMTSGCVSRGLLEACQAAGAYEISLPISVPADYKNHYALTLRELADFVFGRCGAMPSIYVAARRLSPSENTVEDLTRIKKMPEDYAATLMVSGVRLSDFEKKDLTYCPSVDYEPAIKKRRVPRPIVDFLFKSGPVTDICVMRRPAPPPPSSGKSLESRKALKRSLENILS